MPQNSAVARVGRDAISETLGREIVDGGLIPGTVLTLESLQQRFKVSRTVARDSVKVLESHGLLYSKRRIGLVVTAAEQWSVFSPAVIAWRLASSHAREAFIELTQLRIAVETEAAAMAALRRSEDQARRLLDLAAAMRRLGEAEQLEEFMLADVAYHRLLLEAGANSMFAALADVVAEVLTGRTQHGLMPTRPMPEALDAHERVARAIAEQDSKAARGQMEILVGEVRSALEQ
ncbi:FadR/GntR family transcriptional regulator [Nesterenkonia lutea]|uniref:DNA-binding FadR family transcriptional regulator n=1 Tax=Nesterenkonia lutea TaxID=272919 RepID=A0ABR9JD12_9MICC|nr:FCD domain-containing protein [Nesterenkonia lutea]MBE1523821.1 DNA-binding FadR family transcriptional regulator [Nesterenkonia lutea]